MAKSVITIPATVNRHTAAPIGSYKKRRVAAYARVSTDHEEQQSSYEAQVDYYTNYINGREDWEFVSVYADEGITGCNTKKRDGFNKMVEDALSGAIDLIITKSVSRFARNTVDSLTTIRRIYGLFLQGRSPHAIAKLLTAEGIPSPGGKEAWSSSTVKSILTNEKYKGDALLQKVYTVDFLTKQKKVNEGEVPQYYVENNHQAIISPSVFEEAQHQMTARHSGKNRAGSMGVFSGRIKCADCGGWYGSKVWHSNSKYRKTIWQCNHKFDGGEKCGTPHLDEETIKQLFLKAANAIFAEKDGVREDYDSIKDTLFGTAERQAKREKIGRFVSALEKRDGPLTEFNEDDWYSLVEYATVYSREDIRFTFKNGMEIKA